MSSDYRENKVIFATSLKALFSLEGEEFILCCFQVLLHRQPAADELNSFLELFNNGESRISLVAKLAESKEGKSVAAVMPGLKRALKRFRRSRIPIVGWLFRVAYMVPPRRAHLMKTDRVIRLSPRAGEILGRIELEAEKFRPRKEIN